jgi:hypothetical protein
MKQQDRFRQAAERAHNRAYDTDEYFAEFFNYSEGSYDPDTGQMVNQSRSKFGDAQVELVAPAMDTTVRAEGTSFSFDTSIRLPEDKAIVGQLTPLGEDAEQPTEVEVTDTQAAETVTYELHGYSIEYASGMIMCRLVEE